jgi:hypothetical protein
MYINKSSFKSTLLIQQNSLNKLHLSKYFFRTRDTPNPISRVTGSSLLNPPQSVITVVLNKKESHIWMKPVRQLVWKPSATILPGNVIKHVELTNHDFQILLKKEGPASFFC